MAWHVLAIEPVQERAIDIGLTTKDLAENAWSFIFSTRGSMTLLGYEGYHNNIFAECL